MELKEPAILFLVKHELLDLRKQRNKYSLADYFTRECKDTNTEKER